MQEKSALALCSTFPTTVWLQWKVQNSVIAGLCRNTEMRKGEQNPLNFLSAKDVSRQTWFLIKDQKKEDLPWVKGSPVKWSSSENVYCNKLVNINLKASLALPWGGDTFNSTSRRSWRSCYIPPCHFESVKKRSEWQTLPGLHKEMMFLLPLIEILGLNRKVLDD